MILRLLTIVLAATLASCGGSKLECGPGTERDGNECVVAKPAVDPLIGTWSYAYPGGSGSYRCFFVNGGSWDCFWTDGWPSTWQKMADNEYLFGISNGPSCIGKTTFNADLTQVTLSLDCGTGPYSGSGYVLSRTQ